MEMEYDVIGEPPLSGAVQEMITSSGIQVVVGALGTAGICAAKIATVLEY